MYACNHENNVATHALGHMMYGYMYIMCIMCPSA